ncbi:MAG: biopolymer transporter ExbD [Ignavibacteriales bacterium]|nr:biopolymer transporter ExbD [Ignavibacteriales bacterium]
MKFKTTAEPLSIFSYSSLTDIVMLLLIFFLLSSQFINQSGVKVKLPGSKMSPESVQSQLVVTITETGAVYAGTKEVGLGQLATELTKLKDATPDDNLIIMSDKTVTIEVLIKVIDAAKAAGIEKFTIQTEKEKQDK